MNWIFPYRGETEILDEAARTAAPGSFVQLTDGCTHYELGGPQAGRAVVLVHGFSVPYFIWEPTFQALTGAGFRTLRFDLFGRGYSDRPRARYDLDFFTRQLEELLEALKLERVTLIGLSMGGPIAAAFTAHQPARVRGLALVDPIGFEPLGLSAWLRAALLPGVGELALGLLGNERLLKSIAADFFDPEQIGMFQEQYRVQMKYRGFKRAILATMRHGALEGFPQVYRRVGELGMPVMLIWGEQDRTIPLQNSRAILQAIQRTAFHAIENSGHIPHYERPDLVNPILIDFAGKNA
jgi:pimeloyl-ACP methyl ester carboxylesterase